MENRVPVPTDNIYKFYALFGLLLLIFSCGAFLYLIRSTNDVIYATVPELAGLKQISQPSPTEKARIELLQKKLEITKSDEGFILKVLAGFISVSLTLMGFGFFKWHRDVQPVLDRTAKVELEIAELQLAKLRREAEAMKEADQQRAQLEAMQTPKI